MTDIHAKERTQDELPQSASGTTIMTTEPKFVPKEAAGVKLSDDLEVKIRMIDCVGFMAEGASGHIEKDEERQVKTPWFEYEIPFTKAAAIGTQKVIRDHATIGIVVTTDGSVTDLPRENYIQAEERTVKELKAIGKPFMILLNCKKPYTEESKKLQEELREKYETAVLPVNCEQMKEEDIHEIMRQVLYEFPVSRVEFYMPKWVEMLPFSHPLKTGLIEKIREKVPGIVLRTTLITGFPGETKEQFNRLGDFVQDMQFDHLGCFAYSEEEGTKAAEFEDQIDEDVRAHRADIIMEQQAEVSAAKNAAKLGKRMTAVVEGYDKYAGCYFGRTAADAPDIDGKVFIKSDSRLRLGQYITVEVFDTMDYDLLAEEVTDEPAE